MFDNLEDKKEPDTDQGAPQVPAVEEKPAGEEIKQLTPEDINTMLEVRNKELLNALNAATSKLEEQAKQFDKKIEEVKAEFAVNTPKRQYDEKSTVTGYYDFDALVGDYVNEATQADRREAFKLFNHVKNKCFR